jgi:hypothetical protein
LREEGEGGGEETAPGEGHCGSSYRIGGGNENYVTVCLRGWSKVRSGEVKHGEKS